MVESVRDARGDIEWSTGAIMLLIAKMCNIVIGICDYNIPGMKKTEKKWVVFGVGEIQSGILHVQLALVC